MGVVVGAAFIAGIVGRVMYKKNAGKKPLKSKDKSKTKPLRMKWQKEYSGILPVSSSPAQTHKAIVKSLQQLGVIIYIQESRDAIKACIQVSPLNLRITYNFCTESDQSVRYTVSSRNIFCTTKRIIGINANMLSSYRTLSDTE